MKVPDPVPVITRLAQKAAAPVVLVAVCLLATTAASTLAIAGSRTGFLNASVGSRVEADYSADEVALRIPPISPEIIDAVRRDRDPSSGDGGAPATPTPLSGGDPAPNSSQGATPGSSAAPNLTPTPTAAPPLPPVPTLPPTTPLPTLPTLPPAPTSPPIPTPLPLPTLPPLP